MGLVAHILLYAVSLGAVYLVLSKVRWGSFMERPDGAYGLIIRTLLAMFVFAAVFRLGLYLVGLVDGGGL